MVGYIQLASHPGLPELHMHKLTTGWLHKVHSDSGSCLSDKSLPRDLRLNSFVTSHLRKARV